MQCSLLIGGFYLMATTSDSTALTVGETGIVLGELRYREAFRSERSERGDKAWGETRFTSGTAGTD